MVWELLSNGNTVPFFWFCPRQALVKWEEGVSRFTALDFFTPHPPKTYKPRSTRVKRFKTLEKKVPQKSTNVWGTFISYIKIQQVSEASPFAGMALPGSVFVTPTREPPMPTAVQRGSQRFPKETWLQTPSIHEWYCGWTSHPANQLISWNIVNIFIYIYTVYTIHYIQDINIVYYMNIPSPCRVLMIQIGAAFCHQPYLDIHLGGWLKVSPTNGSTRFQICGPKLAS